GHGLLAHGGAVTVDPLAVVGVLRLEALYVGGALGELRHQVRGLLAAPFLDWLSGNHLWDLFRGLPGLPGLPLLTISRLVLGPGGRRLGGTLGRGRPAGTCGAGRLGRRVLPPNLAGHRVD